MSIEAVIFDIGNVLIEWQPERLYDARIGEARRRAMFAEVDLHGMNDRVDQGQDFHDTVMACAARYPKWRDEIAMWHDHWLEMAQPEIPESVAILRGLRAEGVPVFALSNFGIQTFALAEPVYPFLKEFDRRFISGTMGVTKPNAEIYRQVEVTSGIAPDRLLFTDDREENIAAAAARGWQVHLFDGPGGFAARLEDLGVPRREAAR